MKPEAETINNNYIRPKLHKYLPKYLVHLQDHCSAQRNYYKWYKISEISLKR